MNIAFTVIMLVSVILSIIFNPAATITSMLAGGKSAIDFSLKLLIIYAIWLSLLKILEKSNTDKLLAKGLHFPIQKLFKNESEQTYKYISLNLSANILGMGGVATPMGIKATESMVHRKNRIMLTVINSSSIQLIPTTIIAMRAELGAKLDIILPSLIVTFVTTALGIILVKVFVK